ncbi:hypothetical protein P3W24_00905 [Luteibacter sp. PPL201]|uniref:Uncharacterized protein n=1 Tax=Luteibacter sahnii TaxID=3021977 RepID=A0ABT6B6L9_9GAMM|nr:hypothetical protein [Luteibacter sp. PPL193]MDY1548525.1 hypothetical protein [Luteibacter sp. PPL193]
MPMSLLDRFRPSSPALLVVVVDGEPLCTITADELPVEKTPSMRVSQRSVVAFVDSDGTAHRHALPPVEGWAHFSIRVHASRACQADVVIGDSATFDPDAVLQDRATGVRFQPFFLPGAPTTNAAFAGQGLFARGLHFSGNVTPGVIRLSCECDACHRSFLIRSYHAGFSNAGYFYSASGRFTLVVGTHVPGSPAPLSAPDQAALATLERSLPAAPDGTRYAYMNPFRCPHCAAPYIDFAAHPGLREKEYYGNYFDDVELQRVEPPEPPATRQDND